MTLRPRLRRSSLALAALLAATALANASPATNPDPASLTTRPATVTEAATAAPGPHVFRLRWEEDSLPRDLDRWAVERDADLWAPSRADTLTPGHRGCWAAVTSHATLLRCPDGHRELRVRSHP